MIGRWKHNKTGNIYYVERKAITNATNAQDGEKMVLYFNDDSVHFVREVSEFMSKFTKVEDSE